MDELSPCPFCGSLDVEIVEPSPFHASGWFTAYCDNCGAMGGADISHKAATDCWNQRTTSSGAADK